MARPAPRSTPPAARPRPGAAAPRRCPAPARRVRPGRVAAALGLLLVASGVPAMAQKASSRQETVYSAGLRNAAGARVEFECWATRPAGPELSVGLVLPQESRLRREGGIAAKLVADDLAFDAAFVPLGASSGQAVYRWVAAEAAALAVVRRVAKALGTEGELRVQDVETGAAETFAYTVEQSAAIVDALRRCNPISVQARRDAAGLSPPALIALERNFANKCRGGAGDERFRDDACEERQEYVDRLSALGMCYGRKNETPQQMSWHKCGSGSYR